MVTDGSSAAANAGRPLQIYESRRDVPAILSLIGCPVISKIAITNLEKVYLV